jgi:hypothetical protein
MKKLITSYVPPPGTTMIETSKSDCRGRCKVPIAKGGSNQEFVLVGFSLERDTVALDHLGALVRYNDANTDDPYTVKIRAMSVVL